MYGALSLSGSNVGFDAQGTAMVPVSAGKNKLGTIELKSPLDTFKDTFFDMKESLSAMVGIQTEEAKRQEFVDRQLLEQKSFENEQANKKFDEAGMSGPALPTLNDFDGVDTDGPSGETGPGESVIGSILNTLKDSFQKVEFGEKMTALLLAGGLFLFMKYKDKIIEVLTPVVEGIMNFVDFLGGPEKSLMYLFGLILAIKLAPIISLVFSVVDFLGVSFLKGIKKLKAAFTAMRTFMMTELIPGIRKSYSSGKFGKVLKMLSRAFLAMRVFMTATLIPTLMGIVSSMMAALIPLAIPIAIIVGIVATIAAVLYSIKAGFDTFKESLDGGDSLILAIGKGISSFMLTLALLPLTLVKKLIGFIAGLFGFEGVKEYLDKMSLPKMVGNILTDMFTGLVKIVKAIAMGVGAAFKAALPGGKTPGAEFKRAFNEVMSGGKGKSEMEKADDSAGIETGDGSIAEEIGKESNAKVKAKAKFMEREADFIYDDKDSYMARNIRGRKDGPEKFLNRREKTADMLFQMNEADKLAYDKQYDNSGTPIVVNNNTQGDVYNQKSETNVTGELEVNNTESSQRLINAMA